MSLDLVDGSLVLWGLSGQGYRPFVRKAIIEEGLLPALDELQELSRQRAVTLAAYVSLPRTTEVVNAIRRSLCPHDLSYCKESCGNRCYAHPPCDTANDFMDRDVFQELLQPGWRSAVAAVQLW